MRAAFAGALFCLSAGWALATAGPAQATAPMSLSALSTLSAFSAPAALVPIPADVGLSSAEAQFLAKINDLRSQHGLGTLSIDGQLTSVARAWTAKMAQNGGISHNPNLATDVTENWQKLGENVGQGPDVNTLFQAFVNSPHHYANLIDPAFSLVGIGVLVTANGTMFTTHDFEQPAGGSPSPPPPPSPPATSPPSHPAPTSPPVQVPNPSPSGGGPSGTSPPSGGSSGGSTSTSGVPGGSSSGGSSSGGSSSGGSSSGGSSSGGSPSPTSTAPTAPNQQILLMLEQLRSFDVTGN